MQRPWCRPSGRELGSRGARFSGDDGCGPPLLPKSERMAEVARAAAHLGDAPFTGLDGCERWPWLATSICLGRIGCGLSMVGSTTESANAMQVLVLSPAAGN